MNQTIRDAFGPVPVWHQIEARYVREGQTVRDRRGRSHSVALIEADHNDNIILYFWFDEGSMKVPSRQMVTVLE